MVEKRRVFKKGRFVITRKPYFVKELSEQISKDLMPFCKRLMVVGSIRREEKFPVDTDIVLIPKSNKHKQEIFDYMSKKGKFMQGGQKRSTFNIKGVKVELYYANKENLGAMLMAYTGPSGSAIGLRILARKKGYLLNQYGLFNKSTKKKIAGKTEKEVYEALGKKYKSPKLR